jgi:hypothetical protein
LPGLVQGEASRDRRRDDARLSREPLEDLFLECPPLGRCRVLGEVEIQPRRQDPADREPRIHVLELPEAADHQARADQEREGDRDLEDDQRAPHPVSDRAARRAVASLLQGLVQAATRREGGDQAERDSGRERDGEGEEENRPVDGDFPGARGKASRERDEEL